MSLQVFAANEEPTFSKLNNVSNQTVVTCTSGTRPGSPTEGMTIHETNTGLRGFWNGSSWVYFGMGLIDSIGGSTGTGTGPPYAITGTQVAVNGSTFSSITMYAGHKYRYAGQIRIKADAVPTDFRFDVQVGGSDLTNEDRYVTCDVIDRLYTVTWSTIYTPASTTTYTIRMAVQRFSGSGNGAIPSGQDITLEHLGHVR